MTSVQIGDIIRITNKLSNNKGFDNGQLFDVIMTSPVGGVYFKLRDGSLCYACPKEYTKIGINASSLV